ncbi:MAG: hypothetical protein U1E67_12070 [Hyphomicrobiales bacterium]
MASRSLVIRVHWFGALVLLANAVMAASSYIQGAALWKKEYSPKSAAFFERIVGELPFIGSPQTLFAANWQIILSHFIPLAVVTSACAGLLIMLPRLRDDIDERTIGTLYNWAYACAPVLFLAYPVFTQDLWLSAVWGRMAAAGVNPYSIAFTADAVANLPLDHFPMPMSYGPLWAIISAIVMAFVGTSLLGAFLFFKLLLVAAWIGSLIVLRRIGAEDTSLERALAVVVFGWLPVGVGQIVAEGHNDIAMVFFALIWLYFLLRAKPTAAIALTASSLCKYTTAPLFLVDLIYARRRENMSWAPYLRRMLVPGVLAILVFALFVRSLNFLDGTRLLNVWRFLQPRDAVLAIDSMLGGFVWPLAYVASAVFPILALWQCGRLWIEPTRENTLRACLAIMCAVTFSVVAHLWVWYVVWILPFAALIPNWWMSRFVIGVAIIAPFTVAIWWIPQLADYKEHAATLLYLGAIGWTIVSRYDPATAAQSAPRTITANSSASRRDRLRATHSQTHSDAGQEA